MFFLCDGDFLSRNFLGSWVAAAFTNMPVAGIAIRWTSRVAQLNNPSLVSAFKRMEVD